MPIPPRDLKAESEAFVERLAICMFDGGLTEKEAMLIADRELWQTIRTHEQKVRDEKDLGKVD